MFSDENIDIISNTTSDIDCILLYDISNVYHWYFMKFDRLLNIPGC